MFDETTKYKEQGHFFFESGNNLKTVSNKVPNKPGVYYILRLANGKIDLVYIGKSGTIQQNGTFKAQLLNGRLNNIHEGIKRQAFFQNKIDAEQIDALDIYWFVTIDENNNDLPGYVEGLLLQRFYEVNGKLPMWNKEY